MNIKSRSENELFIVDCHEKRLDAKTAVEFKKIMANFIEQGHRTIVLNITEVEFIDSSALSAIVSSLKLIGRDGDLTIAGAQEAIQRLFSLTRMDRVFKMFPTVDEAISNFNS
jgi:anti-sigma B factor antagonist